MKNPRLHKQYIFRTIGLLLLVAMAIGMTSCSAFDMKIQAADLMGDISSKTVSGKNADAGFIGNTADFSIELFKKTINEKENSLISPLSVILALAMTANGADKETLSQMENAISKGISIEDLNEYLYSYIDSLPSENKSKLKIANSIWFRDDENSLIVEKDFLQKNADYYKAAAYKSPFDNKTLADINKWVKTNTNGMIDKIIDEIDENTVMYLINATVFDAEWKRVYLLNDIYRGDFKLTDGSTQSADFMRSTESIYLEDGMATGFIKPYANDKYSFAALLPNEGISINDYVVGLTGESFLNTLGNAKNTVVNTVLPKFSYAYTIKMNDALKALGIPDAFSAEAADLSRIGKSSFGNLYIGEVLHKTFISVDELGTKAGAVTKVEITNESAPMETKTVILDRPFVYAIIDNATNLPIFIGTAMNIKK